MIKLCINIFLNSAVLFYEKVFTGRKDFINYSYVLDFFVMKLFKQLFNTFLIALGILFLLQRALCQTYTGVFAGTGSPGDGGSATSATLNRPYGVWGDSNGYLYIAENSGARVRVVNTAGIISTIVGTGSTSNSGAGGPGTSTSLDYAWYIVGDTSGSNLYIGGNYFTWQYSFSTLQVNKVIGASGDWGRWRPCNICLDV